ncbi:MAG: serine hydrolase [Pseudohongiella sp.]|nr:serine hydrolase [Pseudohongiella sp.]
MTTRSSIYLALTIAAIGLSACSGPSEDNAVVEPTDQQGSAVAALDDAMPAIDPALSAQALLEAEIALGSAVKRLCSSVLVGGLTGDQVLAAELASAAAANMEFTFAGDIVSGSANGLTVQALYRPMLGCTLLKNTSPEILRAQFNPALFPAKPELPDAPWPLGTQVELPEALDGVDIAAINAAVEKSFEDMEPDQNIDTRAVIVIHKGRIIAEKYAEPFSADMPQLGWSMTKTVTAALTGLLAADGLVHLDATANIPEWQGQADQRRYITINNLMQMSSGLEYSEVYTVGSMSDVILMLYTTGDTAAYTINKPLAQRPGSTFYYSSGTTNILSRINRKLFNNHQSYFNFPQERLFGKLGMNSVVMEPDVSGTFVGSSYMYATPRDWAKIGLLYLQDGMWNGERVLPEGWVEYSLTPADSTPRGNYGAQIWLNAGSPVDPEDRPMPQFPTNMYYLSGFEGQNIVMLPDQELIVLRMGVTTRGPRPIWALAEAVMNAVAE